MKSFLRIIVFSVLMFYFLQSEGVEFAVVRPTSGDDIVAEKHTCVKPRVTSTPLPPPLHLLLLRLAVTDDIGTVSSL
ncbi:unnamed protein product [Lathyrus oleraceus]